MFVCKVFRGVESASVTCLGVTWWMGNGNQISEITEQFTDFTIYE